MSIWRRYRLRSFVSERTHCRANYPALSYWLGVFVHPSRPSMIGKDEFVLLQPWLLFFALFAG